MPCVVQVGHRRDDPHGPGHGHGLSCHVGPLGRGSREHRKIPKKTNVTIVKWIIIYHNDCNNLMIVMMMHYNDYKMDYNDCNDLMMDLL